MNLIPVKGMDGYFRDTSSNSIVNKNDSEYHSYINNRKKLSSDKERIENLECEICDVKNELGDIKNMIQLLLNK
jgi:hypothetical protein|tara:strand:+ start:775 stop:996 length:222 start_codon:yes stop_codon:yes gene_type:complete